MSSVALSLPQPQNCDSRHWECGNTRGIVTVKGAQVDKKKDTKLFIYTNVNQMFIWKTQKHKHCFQKPENRGVAPLQRPKQPTQTLTLFDKCYTL